MIVLLCLLALWMACPPVRAQQFLWIRGNAAGDPFNQEAPIGPLTDDAFEFDDGGTFTANIYADYGLLGTATRIEYVADPPYTEAGNCNSIATFVDRFTIAAPGREGEPLFVDFSFLVEGNIEARGDPQNILRAGVDWVLTLREAATQMPVLGTSKSFSVSNVTGAGGDSTTTDLQSFMNVGLVADVSYQIELRLASESDLIGSNDATGGGLAYAGFDQTLTWQGFQAVRDENGLPVTDYTLTSLSGFDYAQTAPTAADEAPRPEAVTLHVAPNPSRGGVEVQFTLTAPGPARLALYDALGREVALVVDGALSAGTHEAVLGATRLPPGVYLLRLQASGEVAVQRLTLVR